MNNHTVHQQHTSLFFKFKKDHCTLFENPVIARFFEEPDHTILLGQCLLNQQKRDDLESSFRRYLFQVRFTSYIQSLIKYAFIDYMRKRLKNGKRELVIFDSSINEKGDLSLGEFLLSQVDHDSNPLITADPDKFHQTIEDNQLFEAFSALTSKQKRIVTLFYSVGVFDTEIAAMFAISQQSVSKMRNASLSKMKKVMFSNSKRRGGA